MIRTIYVLILLLVFSYGANAATDDFTVNQFIDTDQSPPTTPTALTATPVSDTRIDLSWGASTDDYLLRGYQVFRDAVQIATTTLTSYSDTGLTASTTYGYYVRAVDYTFNLSSSSNLVYATTTGIESSPDLSSSAGVLIKLQSINVVTSKTTAQLDWTTNLPAIYELRWGETHSYEIGAVINSVYQKEHTTQITGLSPNTTYVYELIGYDRQGVRRVLSIDEFTTAAEPDTTPPPNVSLFTAKAVGNDVALSWRNPTDDLAYVRIIRNPLTFPADPNNGYIVYEGKGQEVMDQRVLINYPVQYYTAFAYDAAGNRSSGAVAVARIQDGFSGTIEFDQNRSTRDDLKVSDEDLSTTEDGVMRLSISDITILQANEIIEAVDGTFLVDTKVPFTIHAPYQLFPRHLKSITVALTDPVDASRTETFLLRINREKTAYEAVVGALDFYGTIPMRLTVYDYQTNQTAVAEGSIISKRVEPAVTVVQSVQGLPMNYWWILLLLLLLLLLLFFKRRRHADQQ